MRNLRILLDVLMKICMLLERTRRSAGYQNPGHVHFTVTESRIRDISMPSTGSALNFERVALRSEI